MASIMYNKGELSLIDAWLSGRGSAVDYGTPVTVPSGSGTVGDFGLGMGKNLVSVKTDTLTEIVELGTATANGYARAALERSTTGWPAATLNTSYETTAPQQTFSFTSTGPSPNGANMWFVAGSVTTSDDNVLFGADTQAERTFANGDTEKITVTYRQT